MVKIYKQPFAHDGDTIVIPDASQPDGKISSADGWTPDYQLPKTDPNYKPVGRQEMNGVFKEVTEALGQVQVQGSATWSAAGAPYPVNAQVYHDGKQWIALRANSVEPADGEDWSEWGDSLRQDLANPDKGAAMVARGVVAVDSIADLLALPVEQMKEGLRYLVKEYRAGTGIGGGEFYWDASSTEDENGGTVFGNLPEGRWIRRFDGAIRSVFFGIVPSPDNVEELQTFMEAAAGRAAVISYVSDEPYRANSLTIRSNTHLTLEPGVKIVGAGRGLSFVISFVTGCQGSVLSGYGAYIELPAADRGHTLYLGGFPKNILVEGVTIKGPGLPMLQESDCIYIGGSTDTNEVAENIVFRDVVAYHSRRNILSLVAGHNILFDNCKFSETLEGGVFKKVVDIEPNKWMQNGDWSVKNVTFRGCVIEDSADDGVAVFWSNNVIFEDCSITNCAEYGIHVAPGAHYFGLDRNPPDSLLAGVVAVDPENGWITLSQSRKLIDDLNLSIGSIVSFMSKNGGTRGDLPDTGTVLEISDDQFSIKVAKLDTNGAAIEGFSTLPSGTLNEDYRESDVYVGFLWPMAYVFRDVTISDARGPYVFRCNFGVDISVENLDIDSGSVYFNFGQDLKIDGLKIRNSAERGLSVDRAFGMKFSGLDIKNTKWRGIEIYACRSISVDRAHLVDCGGATVSSSIFADYTDGLILKNIYLASSVIDSIDRGVNLHGATRNCLVDGVNAKNFKRSTLLSPYDIGTNNRFRSYLQNDGTWFDKN